MGCRLKMMVLCLYQSPNSVSKLAPLVFMLICAGSISIHSVTAILGAGVVYIQETKEVTELMGCRVAYAILCVVSLIMIVPIQVIIENHISFDNLLLGMDYP